jgi:protocatechuate 3,4-dioxygenase beta subunit
MNWIRVVGRVSSGSAALLAAISLVAAQQPRPREPIIGGPCEGCEGVFEGLPERLTSTARIAPDGEPGERMVLEGTVFDATGQPAAGVIVYAYHTDAQGIYPPDERFPRQAAYRHGRLRGWVTTDARGHYRFETIRPGSYPSRSEPAHVHMHVIEVGRWTYYIDSVRFDDDPLLSAAERRSAGGRGGPGLVR